MSKYTSTYQIPDQLKNPNHFLEDINEALKLVSDKGENKDISISEAYEKLNKLQNDVTSYVGLTNTLIENYQEAVVQINEQSDVIHNQQLNIVSQLNEATKVKENIEQKEDEKPVIDLTDLDRNINQQ